MGKEQEGRKDVPDGEGGIGDIEEARAPRVEMRRADEDGDEEQNPPEAGEHEE